MSHRVSGVEGSMKLIITLLPKLLLSHLKMLVLEVKMGAVKAKMATIINARLKQNQ
jgi:hypothetical protein